VIKEKERYAREMKDYKPSAGFGDDGVEKGATSGKKTKKKKDPNAPKRAMTAFMFYGMAMRPIIKKDQPEIKFSEMGKLIGEKWRAITPEEKEKYDAQAGKDKERATREMTAYKSKTKSEEDDKDVDSDGMDDDDDDSDDDE
jgi:structure-specific recognition protein 1